MTLHSFSYCLSSETNVIVLTDQSDKQGSEETN